MSEIVKRQPKSMPPVIDQRMWNSLRYFRSSLDPADRSLPADRVPSAEQRQAFIARRDEIGKWLKPCGIASAMPEIMAILGTMAARSGSTSDMKAVISIYANDLADIPLFALSKACTDFRQGRAGDGRWAPTQAEIRAVAERYVAELAKEERDLEEILCARIQRPQASPERKAAIAAHVAETVRQLSAFSAKAEAEDRARKAKKHPYLAARDNQSISIDHSKENA